MKAIWDHETVVNRGKRYVIAGNWAATDQIVINPSYFSPFEYRLFALLDKDHDWNAVISDNYDLLEKISASNLRGDGTNLPPDWVAIEKATGKLVPFSGKSNGLNYSFDAFRIFWRIGMDYSLYQNQRAKNYLSSLSGGFENEVTSQQQFCTLYVKTQNYFSCQENTATVAGPLSILSVTRPELSEQVVKKYYINGSKVTVPDKGFFGASWEWFGLNFWIRT